MAFSEEEQADHYTARLVDDNVAVIRAAAENVVIEKSAYCWNKECGQPTINDARWCCRECCAAWEIATKKGDVGHGTRHLGRT